MNNYQNNQWINIVARLTLARTIIGSAVVEIDDIVSEINAGRIQETARSLKLLENAIKDLMSSSEAIDDIAVVIPEIWLGLNQQQSHAYCQSDNADHILNETTLFDIGHFTHLERSVS